MLPTTCEYCARKIRGPSARLVGLFLAIISLAGCCAPAPPKPELPPADLSFPAGTKTPERDDGRWLIGRMFQQWHSPGDVRSAETTLERRLAGGDTPEEALLWTFPNAGLWAYAQYGSWTTLQSRIAGGCPVVVQETRVSPRTRRFVVATGINTNADTITLIKGDGAVVTNDAALFRANWAQTRRWMMTVCPPDLAPWTMNSREMVSLMRFYDRTGRREEADRLAATAVERDPRSAELLSALAMRARALGRIDQAEEGLRRALAENNNHARSANNLAFLLAEQGRSLDEAASLAQRAVLIEPGNPRILDTQGFVFMRQGNWNDAVRVLARAWRRSRSLSASARAEIGLHLAQAYLKNNEPRFAQETLSALLRENPGLLLPPELAALMENALQ